MKIAVINFSGNVGKSTVAKYVLAALMGGAPIIAIETINADEGSDDAIKGKEFGKLQEDLMYLDSAVIDIGASNVEAVMQLMKQFRGSHEDFDRFVIPTTREAKQTKDTISTIEALAAMGVSADRIRVVFNRLEPGETVEEAFPAMISYFEATKRFTFDRRAALVETELFQRLKALNVSVTDLVADQTDWKVKMREAQSGDEKDRCVSMLSTKRLALSAFDNIEECYRAVAA
jgi:hypothetical protein